MRLLDDEGNRPLNKVWVYLTPGEARAVAEQLADYFSDGTEIREWHGHIESDDGRAKELTLALYDADAPTADDRWEDWFKHDTWTPGMFGGGGGDG